MPTRKWGNEKLVNTTTAGVQSFSDVAALAGGGYVVVWQDDGVVPPTIRFQRFDAAGNKAGTEVDIGPEFVGIDIEPSVAGLADGGFFVTWTNTTFDQIRGRVYDVNGNLVREQPVIFTVGDETDSDVTAAGTGSAVVWTDPNGDFDPDTEVRSPDILMRTFDSAGTGGAIILVTDDGNDATDEQPAIASNGGRIAVAWASRPFFGPDYEILCRIYDANGAPITAQFGVHSDTADDEGTPAIAWLASNRIVVAWRDGFAAAPGNIHFRILDQDGAALTADIIANETTLNAQSHPAITALPNGGFVVSWTDFSQTAPDSTGTAIRLQAFGASGTKIGGEIVVNTTTTSSQSSPSVTALADSRVVVTWTDTSTTAGDVRSQIVDPRDGVVNGSNAGDTLYGHDAVGDEINGANGADTAFGLAGNDQLYGGAGADTMFGGKGDDGGFGGEDSDALRGEQGDDDLFGEGGNDNLNGGLGADLMDGGLGSDTANYVTATSGITVALDGTLAATGEAIGDSFAGIEGLIGSNFADILRGDAGINTLQGLSGIDDLRGGGGIDSLIGGLAADILRGEAGSDRFFYNAVNDGGDSITDFTNVAGNDDSFWFKGTAFAALPVGALAAIRFQSSTSNIAANTNIRFFYETDTGILRFDADGSAAGAAVVIATLTGLPAVALGDFMIF